MFSLTIYITVDNKTENVVEIKDIQYAKDVDKEIKKIIKKEWGSEPTRDSLKYIYDTTNNPHKEVYLGNSKKVGYKNTRFFYNFDTRKYYNAYEFNEEWEYRDLDEKEWFNFAHIEVKKT